MLRTGRPYFLFAFSGLFQSLRLAFLPHATVVPVCMCVTHHLPCFGSGTYSLSFFHFPTWCTIWLKVWNQIAFCGSLEVARSEHKAHGLGKTVLYTCSDLFKPVQNFSHLFSIVHTFSQPVHTCSQLFTPVHTCSRLFTPQWQSTLFSQWQFLVEFSPGISCYFSILRPRPALSRGRLMCYLVEIACFAHLIESYPTVHGLSSCIKIIM